MRILFTIGTLGGGGAERNVSLLANGLVRKGYEVGILTVWGDEQVYDLDKRVTYMPLNPVGNNKLRRFLKQLFGIRPAIRKYKPDLVISFLADVNACVLLMSRFMKCKVIVSERNDPHIDPTIQVFRILRKIMYPFADGYVFQTPDARDYFSKTIKHKQATIIPNPVREGLPQHVDNNSKIIITACRLTSQKNLPMLIDAFEKVVEKYRDYQLHIYGEGEQQAELQRYIEEKSLQHCIQLKGFDKNVCEKINAAEIFVLSSNYEGMSNSMLEALAMGMPTIVTDCPIGGARMLIKSGENGILVPVGDTATMAEAIFSLIEDNEKRKRLSKKALNIRIDNSVEKIVEKWISFIKLCMEK